MKRILAFLIVLTLVIPMAVVACHCCPNMTAPSASSEVSFSRIDSMSCCFMMALVKEFAPRIDKFSQASHEFLSHFLSSIQNKINSDFSLQAPRSSGSSGPPDFLAAQPQIYLSLNILRI